MGYFRVLHLIHMCGGLATYIISIVGWDGCRERHGKGLYRWWYYSRRKTRGISFSRLLLEDGSSTRVPVQSVCVRKGKDDV